MEIPGKLTITRNDNRIFWTLSQIRGMVLGYSGAVGGDPLFEGMRHPQLVIAANILSLSLSSTEFIVMEYME